MDLFFVSDGAWPAPTAGTKASNLPKTYANVAAGSDVDGLLSEVWGGTGNASNRTITSQARTEQQSHYFGRFCTRPLAAQVIPAQNWNWAPQVGETNAAANTFHWPVLYVWRPSNNSIVGFIFNASANMGTEWTTGATASANSLAGASVTTQEGDILVAEVWGVATQSMSSGYLQTFVVTTNAGMIGTPYELQWAPRSVLYAIPATDEFGPALVDVHPTAGTKATSLPLATNTVATPGASTEPTLAECIWREGPIPQWGPQPRILSAVSTLATPQSYYFGRFSTLPLAAQTIPSTTWAFELATQSGSVNANTYYWPVIYVWRPSTNAVVGYIYDANQSLSLPWRPSVDPRMDTYFNGGGVTVQNGDILVYEMWGAGQQSGTAGAYAHQFHTGGHNSRIVLFGHKLVYYTPPVGGQTPSVADTLVFAPMVPFATTDVAVLSSVATAMTLTPMTAFAATSTVGRAPIPSTADTLAFTGYTPTAATATITRRYTSAAQPFTTYTETAVAAKDHVATIALPITFAPMVPFDATSTVSVGVQNLTSDASPTTYALTTATTPAKDHIASKATPMTFTPMSPTAATAVVAKVYTSVADSASFSTSAIATTDSGNLASIASPASYAMTLVNNEEFFSGITYLYLIADPSPIAITGLKANPTYLPRAQHKDSTGSPLTDGSIDTYWGGTGNTVDRTISTFANLNPQSMFFGRFVSRPLAAQTIPPQVWNYSFVVGETTASAEVYFAPVIYVYRPSDSSVVGYIFDGSVSGSTEWPTTAAAATRNFTSVGPGLKIEDGDVLVVEAWAVSTQTVATAYTIRWRMTDNTSRMATQYKLLYAPSTILFFRDPAPAVVPTAGSKVSATFLPKTPTGTQHTAWSGAANEGQLSTTLVQAPVGRTVNSKANTASQSLYFGRHSSAPLAAQTIPAQLWEWGVSCGTGNANAHTYHWPVLYTYRPSDQSIRWIMDGSGPQGVEWRVGVDPLLNQRFSGAAVDVEAGDILVAEIWGVATQTAAASYAEMVWTTAQNSWLTSPYVLQFYTGATHTTSAANPTTYAVSASAEMSEVQDNAVLATYALAPTAATATVDVSAVDTPSTALPAAYAATPIAATSTRQGYSNAALTTFALSPVAATSTRQGYSIATPAATYTLAPVAAVSTAQRFSVATPTSFVHTASPTGLAGQAFNSIADLALYAVSVGTGTGTLTRVANALPAAFSQGLAANTWDTATYYSNASQVGYTYSPTATTVSLGRVYSSIATPPAFGQTPYATSELSASFVIASPAAYTPAYAPATVSIYVAPVNYSSVALPTSYAHAGQPATVYLGRVYTSAATASAFTTNAIDTGQQFARFASATPTGYSLATVPTKSDRSSIALQANFDATAQLATVVLGRVYTSVATPTSFALNDTILPAAYFARVSSASFAAYSVTGAPATSGSLRVTFSNALEATYSYAGFDATSSLTLVSAVAALQAVYTSIAHESFGYATRTSIALPIAFTGYSPKAMTGGFARSSAADPASYVVTTPSLTPIIGRVYSSVASPASFATSPGFTSDGVAYYVYTIPTGIQSEYRLSVFPATALYSKNSVAVPASYVTDSPDTKSIPSKNSVASPTSYNFASPATNSFVPTKIASIALPATFLVTALATTIRRGYASGAVPGLYVQTIWPAYDTASNDVKPPIIFPLPVPMAEVTDTQFAAWLEDERAIRVVLIETKCVDPVTGMTESVFFASRGFVTKLEDGPLSVFYAPLMRGGLEFAQTIDLDLSGNQSYGDIELDNSSGDLDWMFDRVWLFKEFKAYVGDAAWPRRDFRQIFDGTIEDIDSSVRDTVNVRLRDKLYRLDVPITEVKIGGTGPNSDRLTPVTFGECHNITPLLVRPQDLIYVYHSRIANGQIEVRDNGIPVASTFLQGAPQSFQLVKQPYGRITASVQGDSVPGGFGSGGYVSSVASLIKRLMMEWGTDADKRFTLADIDVRNFNVFDARNKAPVGLYATERTTVLQACQTIAASVGGRLTMTALGKAQLVKLKLPPEDDSVPVNLQYNGDFALGLERWDYFGGFGGIAPDPGYTGFNLGGPGVWTPPDTQTFYVHQVGIANNPDAYFEYTGKPIPVEPGKQYIASAYTGAHRCRVNIHIEEYTLAGTLISASPFASTSFNNAEKQGGGTLSTFMRIQDTMTTSSNAAWIRVFLRKYDTLAGEPDSWLFVNNVAAYSAEANIEPTIVVTESDMLAGSLHIADRLPITPGARLGYCKNWTVQEDTAQGVVEEHKAMYAAEWLTVSISEATLRDKYGLSGETEQENCLLLEKESATNECSRRVQLRAAQRHVYEFVGFANLMFTQVGVPMKIIHNRFNLSAGKTGQVISVAVNWLTSQVTIRVLI